MTAWAAVPAQRHLPSPTVGRLSLVIPAGRPTMMVWVAVPVPPRPPSPTVDPPETPLELLTRAAQHTTKAQVVVLARHRPPSRTVDLPPTPLELLTRAARRTMKARVAALARRRPPSRTADRRQTNPPKPPTTAQHTRLHGALRTRCRLAQRCHSHRGATTLRQCPPGLTTTSLAPGRLPASGRFLRASVARKPRTTHVDRHRGERAFDSSGLLPDTRRGL